MMSLTDLPLSFWGYALETTALILNRAVLKSVETTPYELWFGKKPKLSFLKVWGCDAYVKKLRPEKLKPKSEKCIFIGYPKETIEYTFYLRSEGKIFVAKNGSFLEKEFLSKEVSGRKVELDDVPPDTSISHHAFMSIFIALWAVITHYISILMAILSYFIRFTMKRGECRQLEFWLEKEQTLETYSALLQKS